MVTPVASITMEWAPNESVTADDDSTTEYRLTDSGRRALERYLDHMEALIRAMRDGMPGQAASENS